MNQHRRAATILTEDIDPDVQSQQANATTSYPADSQEVVACMLDEMLLDDVTPDDVHVDNTCDDVSVPETEEPELPEQPRTIVKVEDIFNWLDSIEAWGADAGCWI